ncbi:MAG: sulfate transporter family protein [Rhizobiales bacterium]|nr:sulfate transporter family protein [Hyphomicrobiales bacterium]
MFDAAAKALSQIFTPPLRAILLKAVALALIVIVAFGIALQRLLVWLASSGEQWAQGALGTASETPLYILVWIVSIAASIGIIIGSVFLMPAVASFVASFFVDDIAEEVEQVYYPYDPPGTAVALPRALTEGAKTAGFAVAVYLVALPFLFFAGLGVVIFFLAAAYLLSREYFELAAMRFRPPAEAKALRRRHRGTVFAAGLLIALFVSIPIVNLATPLFGMALMVHMHKRILSGK